MFCFPVEDGAQPATYLHKQQLFLESANFILISVIFTKHFNLTNVTYHLDQMFCFPVEDGPQPAMYIRKK